MFILRSSHLSILSVENIAADRENRPYQDRIKSQSQHASRIPRGDDQLRAPGRGRGNRKNKARIALSVSIIGDTFHVQAAPVFVPAFEPYPLAQDLQEALEARAASFCGQKRETFLNEGEEAEGESIALAIIA
jgi:hypothetical protein